MAACEAIQRCRDRLAEVAVLQAFLRWRDPDSNRGHHDFQSCAPERPEGSKSLVVTWFPPARGDRKMFAVCGNLSPFVGMAGASGPDLGLAPCRLHPDPNMRVDRAVRATSEVGVWHGSRWGGSARFS